ncbi:MAG: tRNA uridine(34) 5-carboxymethylaminomethyl modification radical SAM/GNAT enzyme Elp3 [Candidatus Micrarchaeia archaeon]
MADKTKAHNASSAALIQASTGTLPEFSPMKKKAAKNTSALDSSAREAAQMLIENPALELQPLKQEVCARHHSPFLRNSDILRHIPRTAAHAALRARLLKSPTRTLSGVSPIAIMPPPALCGGHCIYCPKGKNAPQSYTGFEPTTMRAIQNNYSAEKQIDARLSQYSQQGHLADKCHLIVMGGTFLYGKQAMRHRFMKQAFCALNGKKSPSLSSAINANERAVHKAIGVTFETRPDYSLQYHADEMLAMGGTQVEMGVQALSDEVYRKVRRGHTVADVAHATSILKNSGFKLCYHMMPGLFSTQKQDVGYFRTLFSDPRFQPDMLKIYPALVITGTGLHALWKSGRFAPYDTEAAAETIAQATRHIPPYVRIPRIQRDIPSPIVSAGVKNSNLRQIVDEKLRERGEKCRCIRCREIGSSERKGGVAGKLNLTLERTDYFASGGKEIFLSFEDKKQDLLAGFLRLRIPNESHRREIDAAAPDSKSYSFQKFPVAERPARTVPEHEPHIFSSLVRELHVYGQEAAVGEESASKMQHKGLGKKLLQEAEQITKKEFGLAEISVLSGPGARGYYRKLGYSLYGAYMQKEI